MLGETALENLILLYGTERTRIGYYLRAWLQACLGPTFDQKQVTEIEQALLVAIVECDKLWTRIEERLQGVQ